MSTPSYRLTVIVCALAWFLVGLHAPIVHDITDHHHTPRPSILVVVSLLVVVAVAALWALLRTPRPRPGPDAAAT